MGGKMTKRDKVLKNIHQALQNYYQQYHGSVVTVTFIQLYHPRYTFTDNSECTLGEMRSANTDIMVIPDLTGTHLVYNSIIPFSSVDLFLCATNDSTEATFVYTWSIGAKRYIGAPFLSENATNPPPMRVLTSHEDITNQVNGRNPVAAIQKAFETMMPGIPLTDEIFVWTRSSEDDNNFQVQRTVSANTFYWNAGGVETQPVILIELEAQGGRFNFTQIPQ